jgi:dTDP-L-rhamnose 4-epimerase
MINNESDFRGKTILVTGGAGFIGCALSNQVAEKCGRFIVLDNLHPQVHAHRSRPQGLHPAADLIVGDVCDPLVWDDLLKSRKPDIVVHLAAETGTGQSLTEASRHGMVNVVGTTQMLDAFVRAGAGPEYILLSSSRAIYGEGPWRSASGEIVYPGQRTHLQLEAGQWDFQGLSYIPVSAAWTVPNPTSIYAATKLAQENILRAWAGALSVPLSIFRFQNVYGPGQSLTNPYTGIVSLFSQMAKAGKSIPLYEDGKITRDFVYIEDVVSSIVAALEAVPSAIRCCDIGSGEQTTIESVAYKIAEYYGAPPPYICGKFRDGDVRHAGCDISTSCRELGWRPRWTLAHGLTALQEWLNTKFG